MQHPKGSWSWASDQIVVFVLLEKKSLFLANIQLEISLGIQKVTL